ncbi:MAG: molybdopterin biosynthesis protein MoeB, partial [Deltaproteobacteria bacterium]|nr:molybdopterin biosynthesis protein MoeB [Deltaproteobacteria bacterium]
MPTFDTLLRDLRAKTPEIDPQALAAELTAGKPSAVIDVREADEHAQGVIPGAVHIPRGFLELRIEKAVMDRETPVVLYCA